MCFSSTKLILLIWPDPPQLLCWYFPRWLPLLALIASGRQHVPAAMKNSHPFCWCNRNPTLSTATSGSSLCSWPQVVAMQLSLPPWQAARIYSTLVAWWVYGTSTNCRLCRAIPVARGKQLLLTSGSSLRSSPFSRPLTSSTEHPPKFLEFKELNVADH
jgi:hypothetical protein